MEKVKQSDSCWIWIGARKPSGYGNFLLRRKFITAHRASWILYSGGIPDGMLVCHKCDNPSCVNPQHLFLGTPKENMADMATKGRANRRKSIPDSELPTVFRMRREGAKLKEIADKYNVSEALISLTCRGMGRAASRDVYLEDIA